MRTRRHRPGPAILTSALLLVVVVLGTGAAPAWADSTSSTVRTEPAANAIVLHAPTQVRVLSDSPVDLRTSTVAVYSETHKPMATAFAVPATNDANAVAVAVPKLGKGIYTIVWHLTGASGVSLGDGSSAFQVDPKSTSPTIVEHAKPAPVSTPARKVLSKWLSFLFVMVFIGALAVRFLVTAPAARQTPDRDRADVLGATDRRILLVAGIALLGFLPATWAQLAVEANPKLGFWQAVAPGKIGTYLSAGNPGHFWELRLLLIAAAEVAILPAAAAAAFRRRSDAGPSGAPTKPTALLMLVGLLAGAGELLIYTVPTTRPAAAALPRSAFTAALDLGHLLGAAVWVGGLVALVALAAVALPAHQGARFWPRAIPRFSMTATISLGVLVLTGLWTAWIHVGNPSLLWSTIYGERLLVKLILVAALALLGSFNLFWVIPRVDAIRAQESVSSRAAVPGGDGPGRMAVVLHHFRRTIAIEAVLGVAILAMVPFLTGSARNQSFQAKAANLTQAKRSGELLASLTPSGSQAGFTQYDVRLPKVTAGPVRLGFASSELGVPETDVVAHAVGPYRYRVTGLYTPMVGRWQIRVSAAGLGAPAPAGLRSAVFQVKVVAKEPKLAKSKAPKVHAATWEWGIVDVVGVLVVLLAANRVSRRLSAARVRAVTTSGSSPDPTDGPSASGQPELTGVGTV